MRLIDADALDAVLEIGRDCEHCKIGRENCEQDSRLSIIEICGTIAEQKTVDAVSVVRCKDCRYMDDTVKNFGWDGTCNFGGKQESTMYNRFCSDGDRRRAKPTTVDEVTE